MRISPVKNGNLLYPMAQMAQKWSTHRLNFMHQTCGEKNERSDRGGQNLGPSNANVVTFAFAMQVSDSEIPEQPISSSTLGKYNVESSPAVVQEIYSKPVSFNHFIWPILDTCQKWAGQNPYRVWTYHIHIDIDSVYYTYIQSMCMSAYLYIYTYITSLVRPLGTKP